MLERSGLHSQHSIRTPKGKQFGTANVKDDGFNKPKMLIQDLFTARSCSQAIADCCLQLVHELVLTRAESFAQSLQPKPAAADAAAAEQPVAAAAAPAVSAHAAPTANGDAGAAAAMNDAAAAAAEEPQPDALQRKPLRTARPTGGSDEDWDDGGWPPPEVSKLCSCVTEASGRQTSVVVIQTE